MAIPPDFIASLKFVHPSEVLQGLRAETWPTGGTIVEIYNELRPSDLYCYFGARFGQPNGLLSLVRENDSDSLIHWEWTLEHHHGLFSVQGHNFRTEFHVGGPVEWEDSDKDRLIEQLRAEFRVHGSAMGKVRSALETWVEFVNPYQRIRRSAEKLQEELDALKLDADTDHFQDIWGSSTPTQSTDEQQRKWTEVATRYSKGFGICFGIRSMLPVLAESYVNLLLYILMRPELKADTRLRENVFRQPIDVRIKSLAINCVGFATHPDYRHQSCRRFHSLVNERNDLLHGNVVIDKLKFNDIHFFGTVPVFKEYRSVWQRALGVEMGAVGLDKVREELEIVEALIEYLTSCLEPSVREQVEALAARYELGLNTANQRLGILFPNWLVDFRVVLPQTEAEAV